MADKKPATPVPAATILLIRDGREGLEIFMVVRHHQIDFASGALVFPGGKLADGDWEPRVRGRCDGAEGLTDEELALRVGAIRESFEESGVLLAREDGSDDLVSADHVSRIEHYRSPLDKGEVPIGEMLEKEGLRLACDLLQPFAHWITPDMMPKRFDTHFYLAEAPADHVALHDGQELVDSVWLSPQQAERDAESGARTVIFPTLMNVKKLGRAASVAEAMATARKEAIVTVEPRIVEKDGKPFLTIPKEAGYEISEQAIEGARRA